MASKQTVAMVAATTVTVCFYMRYEMALENLWHFEEYPMPF